MKGRKDNRQERGVFLPALSETPARVLYYTAVMDLSSDLSFTDSLTSAQRAGFYARHKLLAVGMILVVFFLPFVGLFAGGLLGVVVGVIISILAYYLAPFVVQKLS